MYWAYRSFKSLGWDTPCVVHKSLESLWLIPLLEIHLSTYRKLDLAIASSLFHCSLVMCRCTCRMAKSCVSVGTPFSWYGVVWAMCICGLGMGLVMFVPSLASWLTILLHVIPMCLDFLNCYFVGGPLYLVDCGQYEQFVWVVMLLWGVSYLVLDAANVVKVVCEYVYVSGWSLVMVRAINMA